MQCQKNYIYTIHLRVLFIIGCSQPSIFSYFYFIIECMDTIPRELDTNKKPLFSSFFNFCLFLLF